MNELISVCVPVYNGEKYLRQALNSIINQTYKNIEVIIVDDRSSDSSTKIVKEFLKNDQRIRLTVNPVNLGLVGNWQKCIEESSGDWIKFLFQDDFMTPTCLESMYTACLENSVDVSICSRSFLFEKNCSNEIIEFFTEKLVTLKSILAKSQLITPLDMVDICKNNLFFNVIGEPIVTLFNKRVLKKIGSYNPDLIQLVDYEFSLRACFNFETMFIVDELVTFRVHSEATSNASNLSIGKQRDRFFKEPVILYHEYLFNKHFKILRSNTSITKLLWNAIRLYGGFSNIYKFTKVDKDSLFKKYPGFYLFSLPSVFWKVKDYLKLN